MLTATGETAMTDAQTLDAQTLDAQAPAASPPPVGGVVPYLTPSNANAAADFYVEAFGAKDLFRHPVDEQGRTMHIHLLINGSSVMLSDPYPEHGYPAQTPAGFMLHQQVDDVDAAFERAVAAGAEVVLPVQLMFWGDRYGQLKDPFGFQWSMATTPKA
jgi:PhnB protein